MPLIQESVYVEIKDDYDGDDVFFAPPPFPGLSFLVCRIPRAPWVALPNLTLACLPPPPTPTLLGTQRPLDFLYSIGPKATLGVVVVVGGYDDDDDEEENGQGENVME